MIVVTKTRFYFVCTTITGDWDSEPAAGAEKNMQYSIYSDSF